MEYENVHLIDHPLVQHKLSLMRNKEASTNSFRRLLNELSTLMAYEVTRDVPMQEVEIETPLEKTKARVIDGKKLVFVSILRAGTGILDGMLSVVPGARVGHIVSANQGAMPSSIRLARSVSLVSSRSCLVRPTP